jgi:hypothetical protein
MVRFALINNSENAHYPNSHMGEEGETHAKTAPEAGHAKHPKSNSYT